jgi:hypothetical protein
MLKKIRLKKQATPDSKNRINSIDVAVALE